MILVFLVIFDNFGDFGKFFAQKEREIEKRRRDKKKIEKRNGERKKEREREKERRKK